METFEIILNNNPVMVSPKFLSGPKGKRIIYIVDLSENMMLLELNENASWQCVNDNTPLAKTIGQLIEDHFD